MTYRSACTCYCHGPNGETRGLHIVACCTPDPIYTSNEIIDDGWITLEGWIDPPEPPDGYHTEVKRYQWLGMISHYKFVKS